MKKKLLAGLALGLFTVGMTSNVFAMNISSFDNAANMAAAIAGTGVTISNAAYTGANAASGYFTNGDVIGIKSGIVLTSGTASHLNGTTNTQDGITGNNGVAGSAKLNGLIPGYSTNDASTLAFDFEFSNGSSGNAYFNFAFGSEEYNEYVNSNFNDVFGFFLDGVNVAKIPGTNTNISINNVNNGLNASYYNDNDSNGAFDFEYDGFTDVFTIAMEDLSAGTHHMELSIADAGDFVLDSGVFIQGSSFGNVDPVDPVPEPATMLLFGTGLAGLVGARLRRKK